MSLILIEICQPSVLVPLSKGVIFPRTHFKNSFLLESKNSQFSEKNSSDNFKKEDLQLYDSKRAMMVKSQIEARGITALRVLKVMLLVPRHLFVPEELRELSYGDGPLPIGYGQTISQPYVVALMCQAANISATDKVLDIGTGSGYQAAVLSMLGKEVYSIELLKPLGEQAKILLHNLGYKNVHVKIGNGYEGWLEHAPYNAILVAAAAEEVPQALIDQLTLNGRLIIPLGTSSNQHLMRYTKTNGGLKEEDLGSVAFVPFKKETKAEKGR